MGNGEAYPEQNIISHAAKCQNRPSRVGAAYVALSRVRRLENLYFLTATGKSHYRPVTDEDN